MDLRLRTTIKDTFHFEKGMRVLIEVTEASSTNQPIVATRKLKLFKEKELLDGITAFKAHADEIVLSFF